MVRLFGLTAVASYMSLMVCVSANIAVSDISESGKTPGELVALLARSNEITDIADVEITGVRTQFGTFTGADAAIGIASGIVLGSGHVTDIDHTNDGSLDSGQVSTGQSNDDHLDSVQPHGIVSVDAASLSFTFIPGTNLSRISLSYVFGSEEYEYVGDTNYQDAVAIFVNGKNCALVAKDQSVNVNSVNSIHNSDMFIGNEDNSRAIELHGFTSVLECAASVEPNRKNSMKIVIADGHQAGYDSAVFLGKQSLGAVKGYPCMSGAPKGMCMRPLEGGDYRDPSCRIELCKSGYSLDEAGDECCDMVSTQGYRRCPRDAAKEMILGEAQCCDAVSVQSARPVGHQLCLIKN